MSAEYLHAIDADTSAYLRVDFSSTTREEANYNSQIPTQRRIALDRPRTIGLEVWLNH